MLWCWAAPVYWAMALPSSLAGSALKPAPGCRMLPTAMPRNRAKVDTTSKYSSALPPTRPTFFMLPMEEMPDTTVQNTTSAIIILMSLMKPSPSGFMSMAKSGKKLPTMTASTMPTSTWA